MELNRRIEAARKAVPGTYNHLNLGRLGLTDAMVGAIDWGSVAHAVTSIDLSGNALTTLPVELGKLDRLEELSAYKNAMTFIPLRLFGCWKALHTLLLSDNRLTTLPGDIGKLRMLRTVDLSANRLSSVPVQLGMCPALESINVTGNARVEGKAANGSALIALLRSGPSYCSALSFSNLLEGSLSSDVKVTFDCSGGVRMERALHRCFVYRERALRDVSVVGCGDFSASAWDAVLRFLYDGFIAGASRLLVQELSSLVACYSIDCMRCVVAEEMAMYLASDEAYKTAVEEAKAVNSPAPPPPVLDASFLDGMDGFISHVAHLQHDESLASFEIVGDCGVSRRVHLPILESRMSIFFTALLRHEWREKCENRVVFPDLDGSVMDNLLEWMHTDMLGKQFECDALEVVRIAELYQIHDLAADAKLAVNDNMDRSNAPALFELSCGSASLDWLKRSSMSFLQLNLWTLLEDPKYKQLPAELKALLVK